MGSGVAVAIAVTVGVVLGAASACAAGICGAQAVSRITICYNPENPVAKDFYSGFGFQEVGMDEDGEETS